MPHSLDAGRVIVDHYYYNTSAVVLKISRMASYYVVAPLVVVTFLFAVSAEPWYSVGSSSSSSHLRSQLGRDSRSR